MPGKKRRARRKEREKKEPAKKEPEGRVADGRVADGKEAVPTDKSSPGSSALRQNLSWRKKLLFATVATLVPFLICEGLLVATGYQSQHDSTNSSAGAFDGSYRPVFIPSSSDPNRLETAPNKLAWFNHQSFPATKPANTYRIFCLGGSTTYGRPYSDQTSFCGWLREFLNAQPTAKGDANTTRFELINAGGISYASYRVVRVLKEVLQYTPDLVVIYTGHNEFLEERTFRDLRETPKLITRADTLLSRTRTYSLIKSTMKPNVAPASATNLLPAEVKTRLDNGIGPAAFDRDDKLSENVHSQFRANLDRIADLCEQAECKLLLVSPASNLEHCSPFKSIVSTALPSAEQERVDQHLARARDLIAIGDFSTAQEETKTALELDNRCPLASFLHGKALAGNNRHDQAHDAFVRARNQDICALRATSTVHEIVRSVATARSLPVIDFPKLVAENSENGIAGETLFLDHVHPTVDGHRLLALAIIEKLFESTWLPANARDLDAETEQSVTATVNGRVDQGAQADALRNLAKVFRWAGKDSEANQMALRADQISDQLSGGGDASMLYEAATAYLENGDYDTAIGKLQESLRLDPNQAPAWVNLGVAVRQQGRSDNLAREHFERALQLDENNLMALNNLASLHVGSKNFGEATACLERAIGINPRYAKAHQNLGVVYAKQQRWDEAIVSLKRAIDLSPEETAARLELARLLQSRQKPKEAIVHYRRALQLNPQLVKEANTLAWLLATSPDAEARDGAESLRWAKLCAEKTNYRNPAVFGTLAAAYAETGEFTQAIEWQTRALMAAPAAMKVICEQRLEKLKKHQPLRGS